MRVQEFAEKGAWSEQIREKGIFFADLGNNGTFFMTLFMIFHSMGVIL